MFLALLMCSVYGLFVWLVFFRLKLLKFNIAWGLVSAFVGLHLLLIFLLGIRFVAPYSTDARVVQHTIQLIPRLPEPTLVTAVLVEGNVPIKKGQPIFQFDRRPYEYKVNSVKAQLAAARQNVKELKAQWEVAVGTVAQARAQQTGLKAAFDSASAAVQHAEAKRDIAKTAYQEAKSLSETDAAAIATLRLAQTRDNLAEAESAVKVAQANGQQARVAYEETAAATIQIAKANETRAQLAYESQIEGTNTTVAQLEADLKLAEYYLDNTTLVAPENGRIVNLQVRPGMVSGIFRIGGIASFIVDDDRYLLANYNQEVLKWVAEDQPVEVALDLYPGQIFKGKVKSIWKASGVGQYLPSGDLPKFSPPPPDLPQGQFAVQIVLDGDDQGQFPIGAQGATAIYTGGGGFAALRRIGIRARTWMNWLYPLPI